MPKSTFGGNDERPVRGPFDAALDGGTLNPDCVWFFRGEDCYLFNIRTGEFVDGRARISEQWSDWPLVFDSGISAAVWAGPSFPDNVYFFKDNYLIRYDRTPTELNPLGVLVVAPTLVTDTQKTEWVLHGGWPDGPGAGLHAIETSYQGMLHFGSVSLAKG